MFALSYLTRTPLPRAGKKIDPAHQGPLPKYATTKEGMLTLLVDKPVDEIRHT